MKCPGCGSDNPDSTRFCTSCGRPLSAAPTQVMQSPPGPQPTATLPTVPAAPVYAPMQQAPASKKSSRKVWIAVICSVLALCVIGAAIAIPLLIAAANKPIADVTLVKLIRTDGTTLDPHQVPLDTEVAVRVNYTARFKESGSSTLHVFVKDSSGENVIDKEFEVTSSGKPQTKEVKFTMSQGSGKPLDCSAELKVTQGKQKPGDTKTITFTAQEGKGPALQLKEATDAATKKCREATDTLKATVAKGIVVTDLADRLSKALTALEAAKTAAEANAVAGTAQTVIDECNARITAQQQQQAASAQCKQNQAVIKSKLVDWWSGSGNFPDSMSQLYGIPSCPSGGSYTYYAPDTTPATLHVSCSVHGEL